MSAFSDSLAEALRPQQEDYQATTLQRVPASGTSGAAGRPGSVFSAASVAGGGGLSGGSYDPGGMRMVTEDDPDAYEGALFDWMRDNANYRDWADEDIAQFITDTRGADEEQTAATEMWTSARVGQREAAEQSAADREHMLAQLAEFKAGYGDNWVSQAVSREVQEGLARKQQMIEGMREDAARRGRVLSPWVAAEVGRRLDADIADAAQVRRMEMEQMSAQMRQFYLQELRSVYADTQHQTTDPAAALAMLEKLGQGDSTVQAYTPQPQPQTTQPNWNPPSQLGLDAPERELGL